MDESAKRQQIAASLERLQKELESLDAINEETEKVLQALRQDVAALAEEQPPTEHPHGIIERLRVASQQFESSHPKLASFIEGLIDGLGQIGV